MSNHTRSTDRHLPVPIMKKHQTEAIKVVIDTEELLQAAWDHPRRYNVSKHHEALIVLMVATSNGEFVWEASVRIKSTKRPILRPPKMWTTVEREKAIKILINELLGVGQLLGQEIWSSRNALHLTKKLTEDEINIATGSRLSSGIVEKLAEETTDAAPGSED